VIDVAVSERVVIVLGRGQLGIDPAGFVERAADRGLPFVILSIGFPVGPEQQAFVSRAVDLAFERRVALDAQVVGTPAELANHVGTSDDVTIAAIGREERRITLALGRRLS
jgi:hypothetical protein